MEYLIKTTTHTTGEQFVDVIKVRSNEEYVKVEAQSIEEARASAKERLT